MDEKKSSGQTEGSFGDDCKDMDIDTNEVT
jgi:hypothetical protein